MTSYSNLLLAIESHNFRFFDSKMPSVTNLHYLYLPPLIRHISQNIFLDICSKLLDPIEQRDIT